MSGQRLSHVRKIAVSRPNAVGDFMFCLPALHALRQVYREAEITYLGRAWHRDFLRGRPGPVDRVIVVPPLPGIGSPTQDRAHTGAQEQEFMAEMRASSFDIALQMFGGGRYANPLVQRWGARFTAGMRSADAAPLDRYIHYAGSLNRRLQLLEVAALVGARVGPGANQRAITAGDRLAAATLVPEQPWRPLVLLQPGATDSRRRWPAERFAAVGDCLAGHGVQVAVNGSADEVPLVRDVVGRMRHDAINLAGKTSLPALCALIERAALVVSNDTGPLHIALALGRPSVGVYWSTNLIESAPLCQAQHRAAFAADLLPRVRGGKYQNTLSACGELCRRGAAGTSGRVGAGAVAWLRPCE